MTDYTIIGAGAIGGPVGAALAKAGHDITFVEANEAHRDAINRDGLIISGGRDEVVKIPALSP